MENDLTLTVTTAGGTPVIEKSWTELTAEPVPVLIMYSVEVKPSSCTGWTENRLLLGPKEARSIVAAPATISLLLRTQY